METIEGTADLIDKAHNPVCKGELRVYAVDDATFEQLQANDVEVVQEPTDQSYGLRDCAIRDPAGNLIRIQELR